jgi:3-mercaptopyruvate sulfurtransferase SseA
MKKKFRELHFLWIGLLASSLVFGAGCSSDSETKTVTPDRIKVSTLADISQTSDANYDNNKNGLITTTTLKSWLDNWSSNKPTGVTGNLIILSYSTSSRGYLKGDAAKGIYSYSIASTEYLQDDRASGPIVTVSMVPDGAKIDALLKKFAINPAKDMIVAAMNTGNTGNNMNIGRIWYSLRYWGVAKENLAVLNGGLNYYTGTVDGAMADTYFQGTADTVLDNGTATVKDLLVDNTLLQISLGDLVDWVDGKNLPTSGFVVWDTRTAREYDGTGTSDGAIFEGHIKGAINFEYSVLLDSTKGYSYKDKVTLATIIGVAAPVAVGTTDTSDASDGTTGLGYSAADAAAGKVIVSHCKTSLRAAVAMVAANVILGYPHRLYDGAWAEWGDLSNSPDKNNATGLAASSPWLTDTAARSSSVHAYGTGGSGVIPTVVDGNAPNGNVIINADKAYKH